MIYWIFLTGILLCCIVIFTQRKGLTGYFFPLIITILFYIFAIGHSMLFLKGPERPMAIMFINLSPLFYLMGPLTFWYTKRVLSDSPSLNRAQLWHLLPFLVYFICTLPYILSPFEYKLNVVRSLMNDISLLQTLKLVEAVPSSVNILIRPLHIFIYLLMSIVHLRQYFQHGSNKQTSTYQTQASRVLRSLYILIYVVIGNVALYYIFTFLWMAQGLSFVKSFEISYLFGISALSLFSIPVYYLIFPQISLGIPAPLKVNNPSLASVESFNPDNHIELEKIKEKMLSRFGDQVLQNTHVSTKSIKSLAQEWQLPVHHLRYCQSQIHREIQSKHNHSRD